MSRQDFARDWVPYRDPILSRYPELDDNALAQADGSTASLAKLIAERQNIAPADAQQDLHEFLDGPLPADAYGAAANDNAAVKASGNYIPEGEDALSDDERFGDDNVAETPMGRRQ
ncbi:MAG: hypothetical protein AAF919_02155 [Pseudomonadota bacterium]